MGKNRKRKRRGVDKSSTLIPAPKRNARAAKDVPGNGSENPFLKRHRAFLASSSTQAERDDFFSDSSLDPDRRAEIWMNQADVGEDLINSYAWAIPDGRAIRILKHFSPIIEIGCGANAYWCRLMAQSGIDVIGYDRNPRGGGKLPATTKSKKQESSGQAFRVREGGPEVLTRKQIRDSDRTLFLCYADEDDTIETRNPEEEWRSLACNCLDNYGGRYVVHVGELYGDTASVEQAPWGRSSGPEFQQRLAARFHCLLKAKLPNWIHVRDTISVWKRSETCSIVLAAEEDDEDGDEELEYKHIPAAERLPTDVAAPCLEHLLDETDPHPEKEEARGEKEQKKEKSDNIQRKKESDDSLNEYVCPW